MSQLDDVDLQRTPDPVSPEPAGKGSLGWVIGALLVAGLVAVYVLMFWNRNEGTDTPSDSTSVSTTPVESRPLGGTPDAVELPPLDATDSLVRELVAALSSHPSIAAWLATDGLIRHFTVVVDTVASGATPAGQLAVVKPSAPFTATGAGGATRIDPASYARYDSLADAFASLDPDGVARVYATLKPRLEQAYRERFVGGSLDARFERAIILLLQTPTPPDEVRIVESGIGYAFADPALQSLSGAQKQLLRMGPRNVTRVKARLREIALAMGISSDRLPR